MVPSHINPHNNLSQQSKWVSELGNNATANVHKQLTYGGRDSTTSHRCMR